MKRLYQTLLLPTTLLAALWLGGASPAYATFQINFTVNGKVTSVVDGSDADIYKSTAGKIGFSGQIDGFDITVVLSTSNSPGTNTLAQLTVGALDVSNTLDSSNTILIQAADQGYTSGTQGTSLTLSSTLKGTVTQDYGLTSTLNFRSYADDANNPLSSFPFATAFSTDEITKSLTQDDPSGGEQSFLVKVSKSGFIDSAEPYSLANRLEITLAGNATLTAVTGITEAKEIIAPEPATWSTGLLSAGLLGWSYRRRQKARSLAV